MYAVIGGIDLDPEQPGYKHIIMRPRPGGGLTYAKTGLHSMYGLIRSEWTLENNNFEWHITIPANTTATVYVPALNASHIIENGNSVEKAQGVKYLRAENGYTVFAVEAGSYSFSSQLDKPV